MICDILGFALEDAGYRVEKASNGEKALETLTAGLAAQPPGDARIELLITDYMMPVMNGEELARALRAEPSLQALPIILMSGAQASIGRENPGLFDGVLDKPFDTELLIAMVQQLLPLPGE